MKFWATKTVWRSWLGTALIAGCVCSLLLVSGCGKGGRGTPEKATQKLFDAMKDKDLDAMMACFAPDVRKMFEEMMEVQGKEKVQKQIAHGGGKLGKLKILGTKIDADWAEVETSVTVDGKESKDTLSLHKIDGAWLVDLPEDQKKGMKTAVEMMKNPDKMKEMMQGMMEKMKQSVPKEPE